MTEQEYALICRHVKRAIGIDLTAYKSQQMQRRLDAYLRRSGAKDWPDYLRRLDRDGQEQASLRNYLTINVSSFFRDAEKWQQLSERILPGLTRPGATLTMWSAGCSIGAEPYTLAILAELRGMRRYEVWATDIDRGVLAIARAGGPYTDEDLKNAPEGVVRRFFDRRPDGLYVKPALRDRVSFAEFNLLEDRADRLFDLIVCRNVIIYFTDLAKQKVLMSLAQSLRPGGVLFIGGTEVIPATLARALDLQAVGISFYSRMGVPVGA